MNQVLKRNQQKLIWFIQLHLPNNQNQRKNKMK